jgi:hypothetical protein
MGTVNDPGCQKAVKPAYGLAVFVHVMVDKFAEEELYA